MKQGDVQTIGQIIALPKKTKQERRKEFVLFKENFDLILKYSELIINTPKYFHSYIESSTVSLAYMGGYYAHIGALLQLWEEDSFVDECNQCNGKLYFFQGGGSPLSGGNGCMGICGECGTILCKRLDGTKALMKAFDHVKYSLNTRLILRKKGQAFSFKDGLVGDPVPDKVIESGVEPVTMTELLADLRKINSQGPEEV
jgi:hypothetical protein